jgi:hypothetical protein
MHEMEGPRPVLRHKTAGCPAVMHHSTYYRGQ